MKVFMFLLSAILLSLLGVQLNAQRVSVSTNCVEWANLATMNIEAGVAVGRHFSIHTGVRVNPWVWRPSSPEERFNDPAGVNERQFQNKKQSYNLSLRYWPWYVFSGWWFNFKGQYSEYDHGGVITHQREAGDAFGAGLGFGYSYLLHKHWNLDFGVGLWGGYKKYGSYRCTNCGQPLDSGWKYFIMPDDVIVSLVYVF